MIYHQPIPCLGRHWAVQPDQLNHSAKTDELSSLAEEANPRQRGSVAGYDASERVGCGVNSAQTGSGIATRRRGSERE